MQHVLAAIILVTLLCIGELVTSQELNWDVASYSGGNVSVLDGAMELYWKPVDQATYSSSNFEFALVTPLRNSKGWAGFGIGEPGSGSMPGADMVILNFDAAVSAAPTYGDYFADSFAAPVLDCAGVGQDEWKLIKTTSNSTRAVFELSRAFTVKDSKYDRSIELSLNSVKFVFAYGAGTSNMSYHGANRQVSGAHLAPTVQSKDGKVKLRDAVQMKVDALANNGKVLTATMQMASFTIPNKETTYAFTPCVNSPPNNNASQPAFLIGFESFGTPGNERYLHHMVAKGYLSADCKGTSADFFAVASKHTPFPLPEGVGIRALGTFKSFALEIHYDNPTFVSGVVDNSGMHLYYSYEPVSHEAGMLQLGDPAVITTEEIKSGIQSYHYKCTSEWLSGWEVPEVTVFAEMFHMHAVGFRMNTTQYAADGVTVKRSSAIDYYNFGTQQAVMVEPYTIAKTDQLHTTCTYNVKSGSKPIAFGTDSDEEMCIDFLMYYPFQPKIQGTYCGPFLGGSVATVEEVRSSVQLGRSFGESCDGGWALGSASGDVSSDQASGAAATLGKSRRIVVSIQSILLVVCLLLSLNVV